MASSAALDLIVNLKGDAEQKLPGLSSGISTLGKAMGGLALGGAIAGIAGLGAVITSGMADAREAAVVMAQTEAVIKSTGGAAGFSAQQIQDMAGSLSAASGKSLFGDDDIQRGQNMLLTFTNIKETLPDATSVMLDMAQALGTDAGGAAVQLGKALNDPIAGISALTRVGVTFSEQQKAQIATMVEAGNVAGAQGVILAELNKEFGGSAAAAAAADGGMAQFKDRMGELAETIGAAVLPLLNQLLAWLNSEGVQAGFARIGEVITGTVIPAFQTVGTFISEHIGLLTTVGTVIGTVVAVFATISTVVSVISGVTAAIGGMSAAITASGSIIGVIVAVLGGPLTIAIGAVALAAGAMALAWQTNFGGIQEKTAAVVNWWTDTAMPAIKAGFDRVVETVTGMKAAWDRDFESVRGFITTLQAAWQTTVAAIGAAIETAKGYITSFSTTVSTAVNDVIGFFSALPGRIVSALSGLASSLIGIGKAAIQGLIDGVKSIDIGSVLGGILRSGIAAAKAAIGIRSPSRMTRDEIGRPLGEGIVEGILSTAGMIRTALGATLTGAIGGVSLDTSGMIRQAGGGMGDLGALIAQGSGRLGSQDAAPEIAGSQGALTALSFSEHYQQSLLESQPAAIVNMTDWFQAIRREGSGPALVALQDQMYLGGLAATTKLGEGLSHDVGGFRDAGRAAGEAYMDGFNSVVSVGGASVMATSRSLGLS